MHAHSGRTRVEKPSPLCNGLIYVKTRKGPHGEPDSTVACTSAVVQLACATP